MLETEQRSAARDFAQWLDEDLTLTPVELRVMRALSMRFGTWVPAQGVVRIVWRDTFQQDLRVADLHALRTHVSRIRRKLEPTPWRIETRYPHGLYRLVHV